MKLLLYNQRETFHALNQLEEVILDAELKYLASDLLFDRVNQTLQIQRAVKRAIKMCIKEDIDVRSHFKPVYTCTSSQVIVDWRLSFLAKKLVSLIVTDLTTQLPCFHINLPGRGNGQPNISPW